MKWHFMFDDLSQSNKSGCEMFDQFEPKSQVTKLAYFFNYLFVCFKGSLAAVCLLPDQLVDILFSTFFDEVSGTTEKHAVYI